jgi:very-short-patch-repair endonuclease
MKRSEPILTKREEKILEARKKSPLSKGELRIANFLKENAQPFIREFYFKEMKRGKDFKMLFFDFYLPQLKIAIEFDGVQHYTRTWGGKKMENGETNDFLKSAFCKKNGISLIRIKHTDIDNIEEILCNQFDKIQGF